MPKDSVFEKQEDLVSICNEDTGFDEQAGLIIAKNLVKLLTSKPITRIEELPLAAETEKNESFRTKLKAGLDIEVTPQVAAGEFDFKANLQVPIRFLRHLIHFVPELFEYVKNRLHKIE